MALKDVKAFALTGKFLDGVFQKFPDIQAKIQSEQQRLYKKQVFKPINQERQNKIIEMNKKSVYRQIQFTDKDPTEPFNSKKPKNDDGSSKELTEKDKNKKLADQIISQNINENIGEIQQELTNVSEHIKNVVQTCENELADVIKEIEVMGTF